MRCPTALHCFVCPMPVRCVSVFCCPLFLFVCRHHHRHRRLCVNMSCRPVHGTCLCLLIVSWGVSGSYRFWFFRHELCYAALSGRVLLTSSFIRLSNFPSFLFGFCPAAGTKKKAAPSTLKRRKVARAPIPESGAKLGERVCSATTPRHVPYQGKAQARH